MMPYFAMVWWPDDLKSQRTARHIESLLRHHVRGQRPVLRQPGFLLAGLPSETEERYFLNIKPHKDLISGAILGRLYERTPDLVPAPCLKTFPDGHLEALVASGGEAIFTRFWGSYIACLTQDQRVQILTDPTASLPCHYMQYEGAVLLFSHLEACPFLPLSHLSLNRRFISSLLLYDKIPSRETGFNEICQLMGGERLTVTPDSLEITPLWRAGNFANDPHRLSPSELADQLKETCRYVVRTQAKDYDRISVSLSGGLDSSIVLSCLAGRPGPPYVDAFHHQLKSADVSEAHHAREVAQFLGIELEVTDTHPETAIPSVDTHPLSTRPYRTFTRVTAETLSGSVLNRRPTRRAVFTGQGGDHLFLARRTPLAFADYIRLNGLAGKTSDELLNACQLSGQSMWSVLQECGRALVSPSGKDAIQSAIRSRTQKLSDLGIQNMPTPHPDLFGTTARKGIAPLKYLQMTSLVHALQANEHQDHGTMPIIDPLLTQPLIELCLQIPAPILCEGGVNRGLARVAFKNSIPESVRLRTQKGSASDFFTRYMAFNRSVISDALKDGELVHLGLISSDDMARLINRIGAGARYAGRLLLIYYSIEAWLRAWRHYARQTLPPTSKINPQG